MIPITVLISGNGSNLQAIIDKCHGNTVSIEAVVSDNYDAYGLKRAQAANIQTFTRPQKRGESREEYCEDLAAIVDVVKPRLIILAGFMKILTPNFVNRFPNSIINIHPSLLPKYPGRNTHQRVLDSDDKEHGITIHMVNEELDAGPILLQKKYSFYKHASVEELERMIHRLEHEWYPEVINLLARWITVIEAN